MSPRVYSKAYYEKNKSRIKVAVITYRERNPEKIRAQKRVYRERNRDKINAWREKNKERLKAYRKAWYAKNRERIRASWRAFYEKNKEQRRARQNARVSERRLRAIAGYGGKCICCGESTTEFLAFDHVNGDGGQHRKLVRQGASLVGWIERNNYPPSIQLLCHNCNLAKAFYGHCPHSLRQALSPDVGKKLAGRSP